MISGTTTQQSGSTDSGLAPIEQLAASFPDILATLTDALDEKCRVADGQGIDLSGRGKALLELLELATRPGTIEALKTLVAQLPEFARMTSVATDTSHAKRTGLFGLIGAMRDPAIQRAVGAAVAAARQAGSKS
jgi:Protein of unknown function (DUF1641)